MATWLNRMRCELPPAFMATDKEVIALLPLSSQYAFDTQTVSVVSVVIVSDIMARSLIRMFSVDGVLTVVVVITVFGVDIFFPRRVMISSQISLVIEVALPVPQRDLQQYSRCLG